MEFPIITSDALFVDLLNHARRRPVFVETGTEAFGEQGEEFSNYRVETQGVAIIYTAMPLERDNGVLPTKYGVISAVHKACTL